MNTVHKYLLICITMTTVIAGISLSIIKPSVVPESDSISYLKTMSALDGIDSADQYAYRIITTAGGLWTVLVLSKIFNSYENAWLFMNIIFYIISALLMYEIVRRVHDNPHVALLSSLFLTANYAMINFGLGYFMDIGGWTFFLASALGVLMYSKSGMKKHLLWSAVAVGVGGLFKEYAFLGAFLIGFYLLYENIAKKKSFLEKVWLPSLIVSIPTLVLHSIVYIKYNFTYFDWLAFNQGYYIYASRIIEYTKSLGSLLNVLAILSAIGIYYIWRKKQDWPFVICFFSSVLPFLFWPAITQRIDFIIVPAVILFASYFFKQYENKIYIFAPIFVIYFLLNLYMDSFVLNFINLPF